jgi:hypothetical protein
MYLTDKPPPDKPALPSTVQVFSVKVAAVSAGLHWPLDVFGMMAIRDSMDHNRNIIFNRTRDNCQTLTEEVRISSLLSALLCYLKQYFVRSIITGHLCICCYNREVYLFAQCSHIINLS